MVTLQEAKAHLRVEHDAEDNLILAYIEAAERAVEDYTGTDFSDPAPGPIRAAVLLMVGELYAHRERSTDRVIHLNQTYHALLNPYRVLEVS